ncbi:MAG: succinate dehydrogenase iron-sulfur subunit [Candidatus Omnitrophota bacterium]
MAASKVNFRIRRFDPEKDKSEYAFYEIPHVKGMTVLEGLWYIVDNIDGSLSFRYSCRGAVCGSCAMKINGVIDLACHIQISSLLPGVINVEPLPYFTVIKDLVVDMEPFLEKFNSIKPYFSKIKTEGGENLQTPQDRKKIEKAVTCILCAACHSACPLNAMDEDYLGPATLTAVNRFAMDSRSTGCKDRILNISNLGDFGGCMKISRCSKVCPRDIEPAERIDEIKQCVSSFQPPSAEKVNTVCGFCSVGCGLTIWKNEDGTLQLTTDSDYTVNKGQACPKGWDALLPLQAKDRARTPYTRNSKGDFVPVDWDEALQKFTDSFKNIQEKYGNDSIAFISTGQIPTEEMAFLGCLTKFGMGILHGDGNTRQCMATAAAAYKQSFGFDASPYTYKDFEESDVIIFVGGNPFIAHPIMWERVCLNENNPTTVIIDPRKTETAHWASKHLSIIPKSDASPFYCLAHILIKRDAVDKSFIDNHTSGFEEFKEFLEKFSPKTVSKETGLKESEIHKLADLIQNGRKVSFWWTMGVNQSYMGVRTAQAIINLTLLTGNIGRAGTGPNSITGQCNAMGSRLFSNTTSLLGGHDFSNSEHRKKIAKCLGIKEKQIPEDKGWAYDQIVDGIAEGKIKGLWIIATNPIHSWVNHSHLEKVIGNLEFCVLQDMYHTTETAKYAHLVLPAAGWGEKRGTFINSERRIAVVNKAADPPGEALPDFEIFKHVADYWGCGDLFEKWDSTEDIFQSLKRISKGTPADISGIKDYKMLEKSGGIQWPFPEGSSIKENERRLFEDRKFYTPDKRSKFIFEDIKSPPEPVNKEFPFLLLTGRGTVAQWHTQTRTSKSDRLKKIYPEEIYMEINPEDAEKLNINDGEEVTVSCCRGEIRVKACLTYDIPGGEVFVPMHYSETNELTFPAFDPYSRQPSYKSCAVNIISP